MESRYGDGGGWAEETAGGGTVSTQLGGDCGGGVYCQGDRVGIVVAKSWADSEPYDFIVNARWNFWRVQVKSAQGIGEDGSYNFRAHDHAQRSYRAEDIDTPVAYAKPEKAWYVLPVRTVEGFNWMGTGKQVPHRAIAPVRNDKR